MGHGFTITCSHCDYTQTFRLGVGFAYMRLEHVLSLRLVRSAKVREQIQRILATEQVSDISYAHVLYRCERCQKLYERFSITIKYNDNATYQTTFRCSSCNRILTQFDPAVQGEEDWLAELPCPACQEKSLEITGFLHWD